MPLHQRPAQIAVQLAKRDVASAPAHSGIVVGRAQRQRTGQHNTAAHDSRTEASDEADSRETAAQSECGGQRKNGVSLTAVWSFVVAVRVPRQTTDRHALRRHEPSKPTPAAAAAEEDEAHGDTHAS